MIQKVASDVLKPLYYDDFACIMSDCEDNCCKNWNINIDKGTYHKYKNVKNPQFKKKQEHCIKRIKGEKASDRAYARFVLREGGECPFQTAEKLCEIHRDLGEEYLCSTCKNYPRLTRNMSRDLMELSITMSCPEAVRVALFNESPMEFTIEKMEFKANDSLVKTWMKPVESEPKTHYIEHGWAMREAAISIMQIRTCSVAHRLIIIAMMLNDVVGLHDGGKADEIPEILEFYSGGTYGESFVDEFKDFEPNDSICMQMNVMMYYVVKQSSESRAYSTFAELLKRFEWHLKDIGELLKQVDSAMVFYAYIKQITDELWGGFLEKWEHVLENYLVSYIFSDIFPLRYHEKGLNPYHHSLILAEQYALLRMLLCGNYDPREGFTKQYITRMISQVAQLNQHSSKPLKITEDYKSIGVDGPAHLYYMLF